MKFSTIWQMLTLLICINRRHNKNTKNETVRTTPKKGNTNYRKLLANATFSGASQGAGWSWPDQTTTN